MALAAVTILLTAVRASAAAAASPSSLALLVPPPPPLPGLRRAGGSKSRHPRSPTNAISLATRGDFGGDGGIRLHATGDDDHHDDDDDDGRPPRGRGRRHGHTLAILTMPHSASARIANEAILETAMSVTSRKLSVVLRATSRDDLDDDDCDGDDDDYDEDVVSLTQLRRYAGEVYSMAWDAALGLDERERKKRDGDDIDIDDGGGGKVATGGKLLDLIVYPQNMPNSPPEGWIDLRPDLSCVCSHDSITGWVTPASRVGGSGRAYASSSSSSSSSSGYGGGGVGNNDDVGRRRGSSAAQGGLREHVDAVNAERATRGLGMLEALHVDDWPDGAEVRGDPNVVFLEDEGAFDRFGGGTRSSSSSSVERRRKNYYNDDNKNDEGPILGGTAIPPSSLYSSVCVGGTFDGMHYGHRKLLTLAVSSVQPVTGRLLIGVTRDEMLSHKAYADRIPSLDERIAGVLDFIGNLAPGMKNRIRCVPISDEYGPPGQPVDSRVYPGLANDFDALVLSHETLPTGRKLNAYRERVLGLGPLKLLCTQRTEPHGMSSTALRRMRTTQGM
ncbi:hypothetical protein ACHAW5_001631 [Stephanodiscus triporus]|uniref:Cytidyltransferase-like domain-containing protein n=1 Tax=Stephanodiscus triporus TaxID=2934178 RepID=A0ABD3Q1G1_9STRA